MQLISRWISLYWYVLLPFCSYLTAGYVFRAQQLRWKEDPSSRNRARWLLIGLVASQVYISLLIINSYYETSLWPAGGALLAVLVMIVSKWGVSTQQIRILIPAPQQDSAPIPVRFNDETRQRPWLRDIVGVIRTAIPFLPGMTIVVYILSQESNHWLGLWLIFFALLSPLLVTRWQKKKKWIASLLLTMIAMIFGLHAFNLRQSLPPGHWTTPMTGASCSSTIHLDLGREIAWCVNEKSGRIYQFKPKTGIVAQELIVDNGAQAFAGDSKQVWVLQQPAKGLVLVENGQQAPIKINFARQGTVDNEGRLWVIDVTGLLWVRLPTGEWKRLNRSDGLLDNTANVVKTAPDGSVWVGSIGGVSLLSTGSLEWQHVIRDNELPGSVQDFAYTNDGKVWYLWEATSAYRLRVRWGVSHWQNFKWNHIELGAVTGLDYPPSNHPFAIDGFGKVWFVAPSYIQKENFLGVLNPDNGVISIYSLGPFDMSPSGEYPLPGYYGVIDDGSGGIFIYNPKFSPLRHWRPGEEQDEEYRPCVSPCVLAKLHH